MVIFFPPLSFYQILPTPLTHPTLWFFSPILKKKGKQKSRQTKRRKYVPKQNQTKSTQSTLCWPTPPGHWVCPLEKTDFYLCQQESGANKFSVVGRDLVPTFMSVFHYFCCFFITIILLTICNCHNQKIKIKPLQLQISMEKTVRSNHLSY